MSEATTCAIVGGGPAGMVLGLLLARAGVEVGVHAALHLVEGPRASPTSSNCLADEFGGHARSDIVQNSQMVGGGLDLVGERKVGGTGTVKLHAPPDRRYSGHWRSSVPVSASKPDFGPFS